MKTGIRHRVAGVDVVTGERRAGAPGLERRSGHGWGGGRARFGFTTAAPASDTSLWSDDVWVIDSTPVECGRSRETAQRSALAGWATYGYRASHSRCFRGLRLHLLCTLGGLPVAFALTGAKADERETLQGCGPQQGARDDCLGGAVGVVLPGLGEKIGGQVLQ